MIYRSRVPSFVRIPSSLSMFCLLLTACGGSGSSGNTITQFSNSAAVRSVVIAPGDIDCPYGGTLIETGIDENGNGILDAAEVDKTEKVCNGADGFNSLIKMSQEPAGTNCTYGGVKVDAGLDVNRNDVLDASEVTDTQYICGPGPGASTNNPPVITSVNTVTIDEGNTLVTTITSTDADSDPVTYAILTGLDGDKFVINSISGVLSFKTPPAYDVPADINLDNIYQLNIEASDGTDQVTLLLSVTVSQVVTTGPYQINRSGFALGGGQSSSSGYILRGTLSEGLSSGTSSSTNYTINGYLKSYTQ